MDFDGWIDGYKVRYFDWIDGKKIYLNIQYFSPGQSIERPPIWDKTVYILKNRQGILAIEKSLHSVIEYVSQMNIPEHKETTLCFKR